MSVTPETASVRSSADLDEVVVDLPGARFVTLVSPRLDRAYRLAGLLLGSAADAEDAVQDALVAAWRSFGSLRTDETFPQWFDTILLNRCRDLQRRRRLVRFVALEASSGPAVDDPFDAILSRDALLAPLRHLGLDERAVVVLHYWADLPLDEVAARLGIPSGTARSRLHRALERMRAGGAGGTG